MYEVRIDILLTTIIGLVCLGVFVGALKILAQSANKEHLKGVAAIVSILMVVFLLLWLPGVSLTLGGVLLEDIEGVNLMHRESFDSRDILVYRVTYADDDLCYIVDEIKRPLGFLYKSQWFSRWWRGHPEIGFRHSTGQPRSFVSFIRRVDNEYFIYIEPQIEDVEYIIIGDFDDKVHTLEEAREAVDHYHLIRVESDYIVLREDKDFWPEIWEHHIYSHPSQYSRRSPGIIAFDEQGRLLGGSIFSDYWFGL